MQALSHLVVAGTLTIASSTASAALCLVDPGGALGIPGAYPTTNAALAVCNTPGSVIEIRCPAGGCTDSNVVVTALTGITITSSELTGLGGPAVFVGVANQPALTISNGAAVTVSGLSGFSAQQIAVWVSNSGATFATPGASFVGRYTTFSAANIGLLVEGSANVTLAQAGFNDSGEGIRITSTPLGAPYVKLTGGAFVRNRMAARIAGPAAGCNSATEAVLDIGGDAIAWLNYVLDNNEGFWMTGRSTLKLDHGVLANNLDVPGAMPNAFLFHLVDSARIEVRNALIYDNDATAMLTPAYPGGMASGGASIIYSSDSCARSKFTASSILNNADEVIFGFGPAGNGLLTLDHVVVSGNWGKVFSMSAFWVIKGFCPPITNIGTTIWNNRVVADPIGCLPPGLITWNSNAVPNSPPRSLVNYPTLDPPPMAIYLINLLEPLAAAPLPPGLYVGRPWSVNGTVDESDNVLDVGYHNPR